MGGECGGGGGESDRKTVDCGCPDFSSPVTSDRGVCLLRPSVSTFYVTVFVNSRVRPLRGRDVVLGLFRFLGASGAALLSLCALPG